MADEWWKKPLLDESYDWSWSDGSYDYGADEDMFSSYAALPDEAQEWTTSQYGNVIPNPLYNEGFGGGEPWDPELQSFLDMYTSEEIKDFGAEGGESWDMPVEREKTWQETLKEWSKKSASALGLGAKGAKIIETMAGGINIGGPQDRVGLTGARARTKDSKIPGGGPTRMTPAQEVQNRMAKINAAGGSSRGNAAAEIMRASNARVNQANNLQDIISAALSGQSGAGGKGQKTIALSSALRQLKLPRYSA